MTAICLAPFIRVFAFVELFFDGLAQLQDVNVAQQEVRLGNLAKFLQGLIERMLAGVGIEPFEQL